MVRLALMLSLAAGTMLTVHDNAVCAQLDQLAMRVPSSANALVVINVKAAYSSPLARAQGWNSAGWQAHQDGMDTLPALAEQFLMAAEIDFEFMQPLWEIAVAYVHEMPALKAIAARSGGQIDRIAGSEAVQRPNDSVVVALGPKVIGAFSPANRQQVNRWVRDSRRRKSAELSPYLTEALGLASKPANHIVLAIDLQGLLAPTEVADKLAKQDSILDEKVDLASVAKVVASIRGVCLEVQLQNPPQGRLEINFEQNADILTGVAKPLLLAVLAKNGAGIPDIQDWVVSSQDKTITLAGKLSQSGMRRVLSVLSNPVGPMAASSASNASADDAVAKASQRYFQTVTGYLDDLFINGGQPASLYQAKLWVDRYARKIEDLETYQVDNEVVAFGQDVAASLHEIVSVLDRAERRSDSREANLYDSGRRRYGRYGAYGYFEKSSVTRDRQLVQSDEANRSLRETHVIVDELRELSAKTRQVMTERFSLPF